MYAIDTAKQVRKDLLISSHILTKTGVKKDWVI